jgi:hypothetical protein
MQKSELDNILVYHLYYYMVCYGSKDLIHIIVYFAKNIFIYHHRDVFLFSFADNLFYLVIEIIDVIDINEYR